MYFMIIIIVRIIGKHNKNIEDKYKDIEKMQIGTEKNRKETKAHGSFAFPVSVDVEQIQAYEQGTFLWHWHPEVELTWVMSGEMEYHVNDSQYRLREGEGLFGNSNALHSGYRHDDQDCTYLSVTFHPRFLYGDEGSILYSKYVRFITEDSRWPSLKLERKVEWQREILEDLERIYELSLEAPEDYEIRMHILLMEIWMRLYRHFSSLPERERGSERELMRLKDMISYIQEHYDQEIRLDDIADHVNICRNECCRFFKRHMKTTIFDYVLFLRIQKSLTLLRAGESITRTANLVGFYSPAYYGQIFRRYMKCTPREYQKGDKSLPSESDVKL